MPETMPADETRDIQRYRRKVPIISAYQLDEETEFRIGRGVLVGNPGDYAIQNSTGEWYPCSRVSFEETYEKISPPLKS